MSKYKNLFPETLLCNIEGEQVFTTSLKIAEYFEKNHKHVLDAIRKIIEQIAVTNFVELDGFSQPSFRLRKYEYVTAKNQKREAEMYEISRDGFALLAMGFTGQKAFEWKLKFLLAFREMERQLQHQKNRWMSVVDQISPYLRPVIEATEQNLNRTQIAEMIGKKASSVTYYRGRGRKLEVLQ